MSLKTFHIFFISLSVLTAFGFSAWLAKEFISNSEMIYLAYSTLSAMTGISLIIYGIRFLHKLRHISFL
ncbi:MAG: hypothetical protein AAB071_00045 [Bacteroidota bacterium]